MEAASNGTAAAPRVTETPQGQYDVPLRRFDDEGISIASQNEVIATGAHRTVIQVVVRQPSTPEQEVRLKSLIEKLHTLEQEINALFEPAPEG